MSVAAILRTRINKLSGMELRKWPRRNDAESIGARREAIRAVVGDEPLAHDDEAWSRAQESHTGAAVIPVAVVGPLVVELGSYELEEPQGTLRETGRAQEEILVPLAHTEGGLSASMSRGMKAAATSGGFRTYVLHDRMTRASCFICKNTEDAVHLAKWLEGSVDDLRAFLAALDDPTLSKRAKLREVKTHVVGPMCHVLWAWTTGDACGPNMMTRNSYALNMGYVLQQAPVKPERAILEANMGGDKKPSYEFFQSGHGKTVLAEATLDAETVRRVLRTTVDDLLELSWAGTHGAVASGMQSVAFTPASAIAAIFACTGQDLGMVGTSSMAHGTAPPHRGRRPPRRDPLPRARGRHRRRRHHPPLRPLVARAARLRRHRQGAPLRADRRGCGARARDLRVVGDGDGGLGELLPGPPRTRRDALNGDKLPRMTVEPAEEPINADATYEPLIEAERQAADDAAHDNKGSRRPALLRAREEAGVAGAGHGLGRDPADPGDTRRRLAGAEGAAAGRSGAR